jgi:hypothetical protein
VTSEPEGDDGDRGHGGTLPTAPAEAATILRAAWRRDAAGGFCVPNPDTYPWQWLWDSCFHAIVWAHLRDDRAELELQTALSTQDAEGFVPHVRYGAGPFPHRGLWGRDAASTITQPPMYGHAIAELRRRQIPVQDETVERAQRGLAFLLRRRARTDGGLVEVCHPWESGCDDSPRWDDTVPGGYGAERWFRQKGRLVESIERSAGGAPLHNPDFPVGSVGFSALVAWNAVELADASGDTELRADAAALAAAVDDRWDPGLATWVDDGPTSGGSGAIRTLDGLLPLLLHPRPEALASLVDPDAHGAPFGPRGLHRDEPSYRPDAYWRGSAWPQLSYLLWKAAAVAGADAVAASLAQSAIAAVLGNGFAEHWDPERGTGLGAVPQTWSTLAAVMATE